MAGSIPDLVTQITNQQRTLLANRHEKPLVNKKRSSPRLSSGMMVTHVMPKPKQTRPITLAKVWKDD